jgi:hypothetical protein
MCEALGLIPQHHKNKQTKRIKATIILPFFFPSQVKKWNEEGTKKSVIDCNQLVIDTIVLRPSMFLYILLCYILYCIFKKKFWQYWKIELRASHLLGRRSTT